MKTADVIVIGGGLAGLMAASVATSRKQKVTVLTYGSGSLPLASGAIDFGSLENLPAHHPYKKIGEKNLNAAAKFLIDITAQANLPYVGRVGEKIPVVVVENAVREKIFLAKKIILATGGFYSGGIQMREFKRRR